MVLSPDVLNGKVFIEDNSQAGNRFLELSATQNSMLLARGIVVAGQNRRVAKVMTYTRTWMQSNYIDAMAEVLAEQVVANAQRRAITAAPERRRQQRSSSRCTIM